MSSALHEIGRDAARPDWTDIDGYHARGRAAGGDPEALKKVVTVWAAAADGVVSGNAMLLPEGSRSSAASSRVPHGPSHIRLDGPGGSGWSRSTAAERAEPGGSSTSAWMPRPAGSRPWRCRVKHSSNSSHQALLD
jgi:hypothetical protein